ncbi:MAG: hypothetical protein ACOZF0_23320 [Thermodesulfobacteriota bacterium]
MAQAKNAKRKAAPSGKVKAGSRYYVVRNLREAKNTLTDKLDRYNEKVFRKPIENGKEFVEDLKKDPVKAIEGLMDDGKEFIEDVKNDAREKIDSLLDDGKMFLKKARKDPRKAISRLMDESKDFIEELKADTREKMDSLIDDYKSVLKGIEKDARIVKKDIIERGKKAIEKVPGKQQLEKKISSRMKSIPAQLNLPSKKDIDSITRGVKELNEKVDSLRSAYAA